MSNYKTAREAFGLSREKLSNLAKLAGINVSPMTIKKLEDEGENATARSLTPAVISYIDYVLGLDDSYATDWTAVERGAPVIVSGEKGTFSFISVDEDKNLTVFHDKFRNFSADRVRLVAPTALPSVEDAALFETRTRGDGGQYAREVMTYIELNDGMPHSVGSLAYSLGRDNGIISRTVASLIKSGRLTKVGRGVVVLTSSPVAPTPAVAASTEATPVEGAEVEDGGVDF